MAKGLGTEFKGCGTDRNLLIQAKRAALSSPHGLRQHDGLRQRALAQTGPSGILHHFRCG